MACKNEDLAYKRIINCTKVTDLKMTEINLYEIRLYIPSNKSA
jgi:hypothetical protein